MASALENMRRRASVLETEATIDVIRQIRQVSSAAAENAATVELVRSIVANAERLGLVWKLRPATVATVDRYGVMRVTLDGTSTPVRAVSLLGAIPTGTRVMAVLTPPNGIHVVGLVGFTGGLSGVVGGQQWDSGGGNFATGLAGTEALTGMSTGSLTMPQLYRYHAHIRVVYIAAGSATTTWWILRVREDSLTGTQLAEQVFSTENIVYGESLEFSAAFRTSETTTISLVLTAQRLSGAATLTVSKGAATNQPFMVVHRDCGTQSITWGT